MTALVHPTTGMPIKSEPRRPATRAGLSGDYARAFPYDAANVYNRETEGWYPQPYSPDYEYNIYRDRVVSRSRDLRRNDGWASGGFRSILDSTIGANWRLTSTPDYRSLSLINKAFDAEWASEFRHAAEAKWRGFAEDPNFYCDATRQQTFTQQMRLALAHKLVDGEDLIVLDWMPERVGYGAAHYATAIRIVDPDRLSNPYEQVDTLYRRGGVDLDQDGALVAYNIREAHQFDWYGAVQSMTWQRVERETEWGRPVVIHDYDRERTDQHRGVPLIAPVMNRMKMATTHDRATLQSAILQAIFSVFVTSPHDPEGLRDSVSTTDEEAQSWYWQKRKEYRDERPLQMSEAQILTGFPGEKAEVLKSETPGPTHDLFTHYILRNIAAQLGITAEQLTQDWSKVNYSSARASLIDATKTINRRRSDFAANTSNRIYAAWIEEVMDNGELPLPKNAPEFVEARAAYARCRWLGPGRGWIDPVKEGQASILRMDAAISTLERECAEQSEDFEENIDQRALEVAMFKKRGLRLPEWAGIEPASKTEVPPQPQ